MPEFLTYCWIRDEEWLGYSRGSAVRLFLQQYGAWEDTKVFQSLVNAQGVLSYHEIVRETWFDRFGVDG